MMLKMCGLFGFKKNIYWEVVHHKIKNTIVFTISLRAVSSQIVIMGSLKNKLLDFEMCLGMVEHLKQCYSVSLRIQLVRSEQFT